MASTSSFFSTTHFYSSNFFCGTVSSSSSRSSSSKEEDKQRSDEKKGCRGCISGFGFHVSGLDFLVSFFWVSFLWNGCGGCSLIPDMFSSQKFIILLFFFPDPLLYLLYGMFPYSQLYLLFQICNKEITCYGFNFTRMKSPVKELNVLERFKNFHGMMFGRDSCLWVSLECLCRYRDQDLLLSPLSKAFM